MIAENINLITGLAILLFIGILSDKLSNSNSRFPRLISLIIGGLLIQQLSFISKFQNVIEPLSEVDQVRFLVELTLSLVLFREGLHLNVKALKRSLRSILILSFGGVIFSSLIFGLVLTSTTQISLVLALLIAAIMSPTDPAATFSMFKGGLQLKTKEKNIIGSESALNDAVAIVLVIEFFLRATENGGTLKITPSILISIFSSFFGGILLGYLLGSFFLYINQYMDNYQQTNLLSLALVLLSFLIPFSLQEFNLAISAAIFSLTAGAVFGNPQIFRFPRFSKTHLDEFHSGFSEIGEILAFGALGLIISLDNFIESFALAIILTVLTLMARYISVVYLLRIPSGLSNNESKFVAWGGIRGLATAVLATIAYDTFVNNPSIVLPFSPDIFLTGIVFALLMMTVIQGATLKIVGTKTNSIILSNRKTELLMERRILISKLGFYQKERDNGNLSPIEYKYLTIPIRDQLNTIFNELQRETISRREKMHRLVKELEMNNTIISDLGIDEDNIELHEKLQEIRDQEQTLINQIEDELEIYRLELATDKTRSIDKKHNTELLCEIKSHLEQFASSKRTLKLLSYIESLIPSDNIEPEQENQAINEVGVLSDTQNENSTDQEREKIDEDETANEITQNIKIN